MNRIILNRIILNRTVLNRRGLKRSALFSILLLLTYNIFPGGFVAGTLVKTTRGYKRVEEIQENDYVVSFDERISSSRVKSVSKTTVNKVLRITVDEESVFVAENQKFLLPNNKWKKASDLTNNHYIWTFFSPSTLIDDIEIIDEETEVYSISIEGSGQFFISYHALMVYNFTTDYFIDLAKDEAGKAGRMAEDAAIKVLIEQGLKLLFNTIKK